MKVGELINALKKFDYNSTVMVAINSSNDSMPTDIEYVEDEDGIIDIGVSDNRIDYLLSRIDYLLSGLMGEDLYGSELEED